MKARTRWYVTVLVAAGIALPLASARAGDSYSSSIVPEPVGNTSDFALTKGGLPCLTVPPAPPIVCANSIKIAPAPAKTPGIGLVMQLTLKNVDCPSPSEGNDSGKVGKCGIAQDPLKCKALGKPQPCCTGLGTGPTCNGPVDGVVDVSVHFTGVDFPHVIGVPIEFLKGQAVFQATEKNKVDGSVFGGLVGPILGAPIGFGVLTFRTEGSDPTNLTTGCGVIPLPAPPAPNTCLDGAPFAFTGITAQN